MPLVLGGLVLALQGRLPLTAGAPPGGGTTVAPGGVDPQAEADRVAQMLGDLAARLRGGGVYDGAQVPTGGPASVVPAPAPRFTAPGVSAPRQSADPGGPRILNGGGAGSFHRVPAP
jgi:hypothetical protein